jgi:hypothetical protein
VTAIATATKKRTPKAPAAPKAAKPPAVRPTLRDQFAMAALSGLIALRQSNWTNTTKHFVASDAYAIADAMLITRDQAR